MIKTYKRKAGVKLSANFVSTEFDCKGVNCCKETKIDEKLVEILQKIRKFFGKPLVINSAYRCATHNKAVGGASLSNHMKGMAADIVVNGTAPEEVAKYAESIGVKGIGLYDWGCHVDTRTSKFFWKTDKEIPVSTFGSLCPYKEPKYNVLYGSRGEGVKYVQWKLNSLGYNSGAVDGIAGNNTVAAIRAFQKANGLASDGIAGPKTYAKLR